VLGQRQPSHGLPLAARVLTGFASNSFRYVSSRRRRSTGSSSPWNQNLGAGQAGVGMQPNSSQTSRGTRVHASLIGQDGLTTMPALCAETCGNMCSSHSSPHHDVMQASLTDCPETALISVKAYLALDGW
jgi:hypothetical protein